MAREYLGSSRQSFVHNQVESSSTNFNNQSSCIGIQYPNISPGLQDHGNEEAKVQLTWY